MLEAARILHELLVVWQVVHGEHGLLASAVRHWSLLKLENLKYLVLRLSNLYLAVVVLRDGGAATHAGFARDYRARCQLALLNFASVGQDGP